MFDNWKRARIAEERADNSYKNMIAARNEADRYRAMLFNAWTTMAGQTRGLQRQRRLIKRLQAEAAKIKASQSDAKVE